MHTDVVTLGSAADIHSPQDCSFIFEFFFLRVLCVCWLLENKEFLNQIYTDALKNSVGLESQVPEL